MLGEMPVPLKEEDQRLGLAWRDAGYEPDIDVFIEQNASDEFKAYMHKEREHIAEMEQQGIMV